MRHPVRVIFLDIDGVVATTRSHLAFGHGSRIQKWDPVVCALLARLCRKHSLKIAVSSVWRKNPKKCLRYLRRYTLFRYLHRDWRTPAVFDCRGEEIAEWLRRNPKVCDYLIIDDDCDMLRDQLSHLVYVADCYDGFSFDHYLKVDKHFSGNKSGGMKCEP